jgi:hypothetical protein
LALDVGNMNDADVISYLRSKAAALIAAADALEGNAPKVNLREGLPHDTPVRPRKMLFPVKKPENFNLVSGQATPEAVRDYVSQKSARVADLARHFNTTENQIKVIVEDPENGLVFAERGWIKIASDALPEGISLPEGM